MEVEMERKRETLQNNKIKGTNFFFFNYSDML